MKARLRGLMVAGAVLALWGGKASAATDIWTVTYTPPAGFLNAPVHVTDAGGTPIDVGSDFVAYCTDRDSTTNWLTGKQVVVSDDPVVDFASHTYSSPAWWQVGANSQTAAQLWAKVSWAANYGQAASVSDPLAMATQAAIFQILGMVNGSENLRQEVIDAGGLVSAFDTIIATTSSSSFTGRPNLAWLLDRTPDYYGSTLEPGQGLIIGHGPVRTPPDVSTPEASSLVLVLPGLVPLGLLLRRRRA